MGDDVTDLIVQGFTGWRLLRHVFFFFNSFFLGREGGAGRCAVVLLCRGLCCRVVEIGGEEEGGGGGACNVTRFYGLVGGRAGGYSRERHGFTLKGWRLTDSEPIKCLSLLLTILLVVCDRSLAMCFFFSLSKV